ncbi:amino acid adenylation domain-containing protein [Corynebacterium sp. zg254]|uniref:Amino acid adenylation domain-containing protein n=1 Tax=Corynebacterium zhongnanshanii TaxID=2768834 RepID=A0ABQ6VMC2_9CORY|nr:amino acid adenylation domain-containing protein [Corynebacterium zhongnanshanii]MCR5914086.1 amino acid adenylation domain-containing protein [Corynebacterium sp. zg254]
MELEKCARDLLAFPDRSLATIGGQNEKERITQQHVWNDTDQDRERPDLISLLLQHTECTPDALAVVDDQHELTYSELVGHATALAKTLRDNGIQEGESVGISLPRSAEMVVSIVATLIAGGRFVPLDPTWPSARRESVAHDAGLSFVFSESNCTLDNQVTCDLDATRALFTPPAAESIAYVIFTSGSTGRPKGAMIRHSAIVERLLWQRDQILFFGSDDASLFKAPLAFDISINEIFLPLVSGGRIVVAAPGVEQDPQCLAQLIHRQGVTFAYLVSSVLDVMLKQAEGTNLLDSLRHVWCGGEMLTQALYRRFRNQLAIPLYHGYGPAEATIGVSHVIYKDDDDRLNTSIGIANPNCRLYVLDNQLRVVPNKEIGELYVAGFLLAEGYINAPGLTASRFVADTFASDGTRMYRTGDLVRRHDDGSLEFVGRADNQVKIRGMRLELEDVESTLVRHPSIDAASVIAEEGRLLGYVTVKKESDETSGGSLNGAAIRSWSADVLPEYMVPAIITVMDELPRTVNGKVDRRALPEPDWNSLTDTPVNAERDGETVALIAEVMAEALGMQTVGAETDFFNMGGDSLRAITLVSALRRVGLEVSVGDIFNARTPQQLARCAEEREVSAEDPEDEPTGEVNALPIVRWFDSVTEHIDGFIQSVEFSVPDDVDQQKARQMLEALLGAHPALRAYIHQSPLRMELPEVPSEDNVVLEATTDLDTLVDLLNPAAGVVLVAGLQLGRLRLVVHHLVVDGVSWNIIGEDLAAAYRGEELATEQTSLRRWAQLLQRAVDTGAFDQQAQRSLPPLPGEDEPLRDPGVPALAQGHEDKPTVRDERCLVHEASVQITDELLNGVPKAFRTGVNPVLLTALSVALARWRRGKQTWSLVEMEGHGRETRFVPGPGGREADLSRTVGWFTCLYPMLIDPSAAALDEKDAEQNSITIPSLAVALNAVKDQIRNIPGNGVPYQAHTWLRGDVDAGRQPQAQVLFNYLGRVSAGTEDFSPTGSTGQLGERRDQNQPLIRELEFNAIAEDTGEGYVLRTTISWGEGRISSDRIDELLMHWDSALHGVAALADHGVLSVGDVDPAPVTAADLATITAQSSGELQDVLPLTSLQHGMYFHSLFDESASSYVEQQVLRLECSEPFDRERFARAARQVIRSHPALSTRPWETEAGDVVAVIDPGIAEQLQVNCVELTVPPELEVLDSDHEDRIDWILQRADEIAADDLSEGISLQNCGPEERREPLMRWTVVMPTSAHCRRHGLDVVLIQTVHHLIADGWSVPIMLQSLIESYRDDTTFASSYDPHAGIAGSVRWVARRDLEKDLSVWREELNNVRPTVLCPHVSSSQERRELLVRDPRVDNLCARVRSSGVGLPDVVHAAWGQVLRALVGCEPGADVVFATSVSGRDIPVPGVADAVGMQLNTIPVLAPGQSDPSLPLTSLLEAVVQHNNRVRDVQHVSLADIARDLGTNASELLDTLVVVEVPLSAQELNYIDSPFRVADIQNNGAPHFPLSLVVNPSSAYPLRLIYDPQRITEVRIQRIASMLAMSVDALLSEPGAEPTVGEASMALSAVVDSVSDGTTLPSLWQRSVEMFRERVALTSFTDDDEAEQWTYEKLDEAAQRMRAMLEHSIEVKKPRVALLMERDVWQVAAIIAITLSGGTYVPVDPLSPRARMELILKDCQPDAVLVAPSAEKMVSEMVSGPVFVVSQETMSGGPWPYVGQVPALASKNDIAYVIYTSGSTGRPKGVAVTHANVTAMLRNARNHVNFKDGDVWSISHSFAFDFSVWEMWAALSSGGRAVIMPYSLMRSQEDASRVLNEQEVSILSQTPTSFSALVPHIGQDSALHTVVFGGEALEARAEADYCREFPDVHFLNMYGITETTVHVTAHECWDGAVDARSSIGLPMDGLRIYVLDERLQPVKPGEIGIIFVAGLQVAAGYWKLPAATASRFVADPFLGGGSRMYCSNDLALVLNNGHLDYVGRADRQVQLRGYRVELGEIESALNAVDGVRESAVVVVELPEGQVTGALLVVDKDIDANSTITRAAAAAREVLPAYMVPQLIEVRTKIPQTINGKRDEQAIQTILGRAPVEQKTGSASDVAEAISSAIADALRIDRSQVEPDSDFFRLGGDSILAIRVTHALARAELNVTPRDFFLGRTPRLIAQRIEHTVNPKISKSNGEQSKHEIEDQSSREIKGAFPAPAMLRRQIALGMSDQFVQARRLNLGPVTVEELENVLPHLIEAHPMLRMRIESSVEFARFVGAQDNAEVAGPIVIPSLDIDELVRTINIAEGRSLVLGCVDNHVVAVAHHAVIDSASWMILEDDLREALTGLCLVPERANYQELSLRELHSAHTASGGDIEYWRELAVLPRPVEDTDQWSSDVVDRFTVTIEGRVSACLQNTAPEVLEVDIQDVIVALVTVAVARAHSEEIREVLDSPVWAVDLEGHGRSDDHVFGRTIGWFTTIAPVGLPLDDPIQAARVAADTRQRHEEGSVPDRRTYQALRYTHPQGHRVLAHGAQILVNYLGRGETDSVLRTPRDPACRWTKYLVEADVFTTEQSLRVDLSVVGTVIPPKRLRTAFAEVAQDFYDSIIHMQKETGRRAPLSVLQRGIWFQSQVASPGTYVAQTALTFDRALDADAVADAFRDTVTVHPAMGAQFQTDDSGQTEQILPWTGHRIDLPVEVMAGDLHEIMHADRCAGIDLNAVPLAKATIVSGSASSRDSGNEERRVGDTLILTYHLALIDGWSRAVMLQTFLERLSLRSDRTGNPELSQAVPDRPSIIDVLLESVDRSKELADSSYWACRLEDMAQPTLVAPQAEEVSAEFDVTELPSQVFATMSEELTHALNDKIRTQAVTLTSVINATVAVALGAVTGETDVVFGQSVSGRDAMTDPTMSDVVGVLLNTVPIRVTPQPEQCIEELVLDVYRQRIDDMEHDSADLGAIQQQLGVGTLFDSLVVVQNFLDPERAEELRAIHGIIDERAEDSTHFPLTWVFTPGPQLGIKLEFRQNVVDKSLAMSALKIVTSALTAYIEQSHVRLAQLAVVPWRQDRTRVASWQKAEDIERTFLDELAEAGRRFPDRIALVDDTQQWCFKELLSRCSDIAQRLTQCGISRGDTVAIAVERSAHSVVALLGTLLAGARYVPLDLTHPDGRLRIILEDSQPSAVLVDSTSQSRIVSLCDLRRIDVTTADPQASIVAPSAMPMDDAYLMYTSGSTGKPKGVVIPHRGLRNMLDNHRRKIFEPATADGRPLRVAHAISFAFDMSWEELFWLVEGHEVRIFSEDLRRDAKAMVQAIRTHQVDVINVTPTVAEQLLAEGMLDTSEYRPHVMLLGGEAVPPGLWKALREADDVRGYNLYGPTEYTINALGVGTDESATPVIGTPVDRTAAFVLDPWLRPVPDGVSGELYLTGSGMAREYRGLPTRTASSMVACPWGAPGERMYRTGDIVRVRDDGMFEYLGRSDDQVKIRGHRVDPGDISALVVSGIDPRIVHCVTVPVQMSGSNALVCHIVAPELCSVDQNEQQRFLTSVRDRMRRELPSYMVPDWWSIVDEIPLTSNGKIDLKALGEGERIKEQGRAPASETEQVTAELFAESLDIEPEDVAVDADYFDMGGHSMAVIKLCALLRGEWGVTVGVREFYALRTVERVAAFVEDRL